MSGLTPIVLTDSRIKRRKAASALKNESVVAKVLMLRPACANADTSKSALHTCCVSERQPLPSAALCETGIVAGVRPRSA